MTTTALQEQETTGATASRSDAILEIRSVSKAFGGNLAVDDCSITVRQGTITGLIGPNGAGKSTLLNIIAGSLRSNAGTIALGGKPITGLRPHHLLHRGLARTFQIPRPIPSMTVLENLVLAGQEQAGEKIWNPWFRPRTVGRQENVIVDKALEVLAYVNLLPVRDAYAANLSGGQKKLREFARTRMVRPRVVLLDEPAAGVNRTLMRQLAGYIEEQRERGTTYLIVEHDMDLVARLCHPVVVMSQGRRLFEGSFDEARQDQAVLDAYLGGHVR